jgi:ElaB/YqjD/DUF883 family membrane-anchored ribosome-binding protein
MVQTSDDLRTDLEPGLAEEPKPEELREQMAETRAALTEKLESLQERVEGTVEKAQETVQDTLQTVKRTFDLKYQVDQRPWMMIGASVLAGYTLGCLSRVHRVRRAGASIPPNGAAADGRSSTFMAHEVLPSRPVEIQPPVEKSSVLSQFDEELGTLKRIAIGAAMGLVRDWLKEAVPSVSRQLDEVMDSATCKFGGEPIDGPIISRDRTIGANLDG